MKGNHPDTFMVVPWLSGFRTIFCGNIHTLLEYLLLVDTGFVAPVSASDCLITLKTT